MSIREHKQYGKKPDRWAASVERKVNRLYVRITENYGRFCMKK